jgi:hypothetical protein
MAAMHARCGPPAARPARAAARPSASKAAPLGAATSSCFGVGSSTLRRPAPARRPASRPAGPRVRASNVRERVLQDAASAKTPKVRALLRWMRRARVRCAVPPLAHQPPAQPARTAHAAFAQVGSRRLLA